MKKILLFIVFINSLFLISQNREDKTSKTISGFIYHKNIPLPYVTILKNKNITGKTSNEKGFYEVNAKAGDILTFSYAGLHEKNIFIEDITNTVNLHMKTVNAYPTLKENKSLKLGGSNIGASRFNTNVISILGKNLNQDAETLTQAILEKVNFFHATQNIFGENIIYIKGKELNGPVKWEIDGYLYDIPIPIFIDEVKDITIITTDLSGCLIKVNTTIDYSKVNDIDYNNFFFSNDDYYNYDAIPYKKLIKYKPKYIKDFDILVSSKQAFSILSKQKNQYNINSSYYLNLINYFQSKKNYKAVLMKLISEYENYASNNNNPEDLKVIAYKYEELNAYEEASIIYKKILKLRPNYAQSFRDLANAYLQLKDIRNHWLTYKYYLNKGFKIEDNDFGDLISSEIISSYNKDKSKNSSHQKIKINLESKIKNCDVRLVFEWNTSEAEFILEFVNPREQLYKLKNTIENNNDLIINQKKKGYSSKEILIQDLERGDWLVNFTYLGNKQYKPTVLKVTTYYNWGRPNQTQKVNVYDFTIYNIKTELLKLNKNSF